VSVGASQRLSRLLSMVPWLLKHPGVPLSEAAGYFEITEDELVKDLQLLFVCGTPGHLPGDLIEADWESGRVYLDNAAEISRPLRLGVDEAVALLAGLRSLAEVPGLHDRKAVDSVITKLSEAAVAVAAPARALAVDLGRDAREPVLAGAREALQYQRRLRLTYLVPSRDETTERDVDPMRLTVVEGRWYLEGWCHLAEGVRLFRLDRVIRLEVLDEEGTPPPEAVSRDADEALFRPSPEDPLVVLDLSPRAHWVADYYQAEDVESRPDGVLRARLRAASPDWVPRLVLSMGGAVRVIAPAALAEAATARADEALAAYGPDADVPA
jgi:predicted DNA-binding transcriptional regulator YafY